MREINQINKVIHNGKQILDCDYGEVGGQDLLDQIDIFEKGIVSASPKHSKSLLVFQDVSGTIMDSTAVERWKKAAVNVKPHIEKLGVVGITGFRKVILSAITKFSGLDVEVFSTKEEAFDWLVKE